MGKLLRTKALHQVRKNLGTQSVPDCGQRSDSKFQASFESWHFPTNGKLGTGIIWLRRGEHPLLRQPHRSHPGPKEAQPCSTRGTSQNHSLERYLVQ